jgi:4-hydroxyphenylpyruvate dioxygenase-like putative hemolysin
MPKTLEQTERLSILYDQIESGKLPRAFTPMIGNCRFFELCQGIVGYDACGSANAPVRTPGPPRRDPGNADQGRRRGVAAYSGIGYDRAQ